MMFYRLSDCWEEDGSVQVQVSKFKVLRETPQGYWVCPSYHWGEDYKRWTPKTCGRYCQASIEEALAHYSIRKRHELRHIKDRLAKAEAVQAGWAQLTPEKLLADGYVSLGRPGLFQ